MVAGRPSPLSSDSAAARAVSASPYVTNAIVDGLVGLLFASAGGKSNVMTLSFFSEVAHHPTSLWVGVATGSWTHELVDASGQFSLALLTRDQHALAADCGTVSGRERDKCAALPLRTTAGGFVYLDGALTSTSCRVRQRIPKGDHTVYVADILEGEADMSVAHRQPLYISDLRRIAGR